MTTILQRGLAIEGDVVTSVQGKLTFAVSVSDYSEIGAKGVVVSAGVDM